MLKQQGRASYVVRSVAWPTLTENRPNPPFDDVGVDFEDRPYGSGVVFEFFSYGIKVTGFDDGFRHLLDPRIVDVLIELDALTVARQAESGGSGNEPACSPRGLCLLLEKRGIGSNEEYMPKGWRP